MSIAAEQRETAAFLRDLAGRDPVETHISAVFIGADTVWKLKKAVRLSFLDFTLVQARHASCCGSWRSIVAPRRGCIATWCR